MELVQIFKNSFLKNASLAEERDNLSLWKDDKSLYIIADNNKGSFISDAVKSSYLKQFSAFTEEKVFITLFNTREDFANVSDKISWNSYVWIADEPSHTIHFDDCQPFSRNLLKHD